MKESNKQKKRGSINNSNSIGDNNGDEEKKSHKNKAAVLQKYTTLPMLRVYCWCKCLVNAMVFVWHMTENFSFQCGVSRACVYLSHRREKTSDKQTEQSNERKKRKVFCALCSLYREHALHTNAKNTPRRATARIQRCF